MKPHNPGDQGPLPVCHWSLASSAFSPAAAVLLVSKQWCMNPYHGCIPQDRNKRLQRGGRLR